MVDEESSDRGEEASLQVNVANMVNDTISLVGRYAATS